MHQTSDLFTVFGNVAWGDLAGTTLYKDHLGRVIQFAKTSPKTGPTLNQAINRIKFAWADEMWCNLDQNQQDNWVKVTKWYGLTMCGHALYMATWLKGTRGQLALFERHTRLQLYHETHIKSPADDEPRDRWPHRLRQGTKPCYSGCTNWQHYLPPGDRQKHILIYDDINKPWGVPITFTKSVVGPGYASNLTAYNGRFAKFFFIAPAVDAYTTVRYTYVDALENAHHFIYHFHTKDEIFW